jgi:hypothetical protein
MRNDPLHRRDSLPQASRAHPVAHRPRETAPDNRKAPVSRDFVRADARTRTGDPFITSEVLYQLSYVGEAEAV